MRRTTPLIVGAGPAGTAAGIALAAAGERPLLIERSRETGDALCGGFLSWRSLATLDRLGLAANSLNPQPIRRVRLFAGERRAEARLPAPGLAVSRHRLDRLLMARAEESGVAVERGVTVTEIDGDEVRTRDSATLTAGALFLASGKHDVRGLARPAAARGSDPTLGLRLRLPPSPALARLIGDAVELHLFTGGYAGLAIQEDGTANLCLAVRQSALAGGSPAAFLAGLGRDGPLAERLAGADLTLPFDAIANVPYGWRALAGTHGLFRLGDQAGVIPSLAGEGMGIALASGIAAARAFVAGGAAAAPAWQRGFAQRARRPIAIAGLVRGLAEKDGARALMTLARIPGLIQVMVSATRIGHEAD
jgi:flavin-dependent dehydrogenase